MPLKLLIVEDSDLICSSLHRVFGNVDGSATIREAVTLYEALDGVQFDSPTLVSLDLNLPDGAGISTVSAEQSLVVSQVGEAVMQMDQVTQQNAALVATTHLAHAHRRVFRQRRMVVYLTVHQDADPSSLRRKYCVIILDRRVTLCRT